MIKRIVKMNIRADREVAFRAIFDEVKEAIRAQPGCLGLELLRMERDGQPSWWTISLWEAEADLERYRQSDLFSATWARVKPLFYDRSEAWSLTPIEYLP